MCTCATSVLGASREQAATHEEPKKREKKRKKFGQKNFWRENWPTNAINGQLFFRSSRRFATFFFFARSFETTRNQKREKFASHHITRTCERESPKRKNPRRQGRDLPSFLFF